MKITVTQDDIAAGVRDSCFKCPIARAVNRAFGIDNAVVGPREVSHYRGNRKLWQFPLPPEARQFITRFDHGLPVAPMEFEL